MKTTLLKFLFAGLILSAVSVSCDNKGEFKSGDLVGKWDLTNESGYTKVNGKIADEWDDDVIAGTYVMEFRKDGTGANYEGKDSYSFSWRLSDNKIYLDWDDDEGEGSQTIKSLTSDELVLYWTGSEEDGGKIESWYEQETYKKL